MGSVCSLIQNKAEQNLYSANYNFTLPALHQL